MKRLLGLFLVIAGLATVRSEVVIEFDGKEWSGDLGEEGFEERVAKEGICFLADGGSRVGDLLDGWGLETFQPHAIRFAVRGAEGKGAVIDSAEGFDGERASHIAVMCEQELVTVANLAQEGLPVDGSASMDADMDGAAGFLVKVGECVRFSESKSEAPLAVLLIRSKCSYGLMVRTLQMIRAGGCQNTLIKVDDEFPSFDFKVLADPDVLPPVAKAGQQDTRGRIIVNLSGDGSIKGGEGQALETDDDIKTYVESCRKEIVESGKDPRLMLRGEQDAVFRMSRRVIRIGAEAGVDQVIFAVYAKPGAEGADALPEEKGEAIQLRETDLEMALPSNRDPAKDGAARKVVLKIEKEGRILMEQPDMVLDADPKKREAPLLAAALDRLKNQGGLITVNVRVDRDVQQQRVIDVLNALAGAGISSVTFSDPD